MSKYKNEEDRNRDYEKAGLKGIDTSCKGAKVQRCFCPECHDSRVHHKDQKECSVNVDYGTWRCYHCGATGFVPSQKQEERRTERERRLERMRDAKPEQQSYKRPKDEPEFRIEQILLSPTDEQKKVIDYLTKERMISEEVLKRAKISIPYIKRKRETPSASGTSPVMGRNSNSPSGGEPSQQEKHSKTLPIMGEMPNGQRGSDDYYEPGIRFNYYDNGVLIAAKNRTMDKRVFCFTPSGCEMIPYNITSILRKDKCYICEGEIDALTLMECGLPEAISVPTGGANRNLSWLDRFIQTHFQDKSVIYLTLDMDEVGVKMMNELIRRLGSERIRVVVWDDGCKDANDELRQHGKDGVLRCIREAMEVPLQGIQTVKTPLIEQALDDMFLNGLSQGAKLGISNMDNLIGAEEGRFCVVTGRPGDGKSEFVDEMVTRLCMLYGWRVAFFSPENHPLKYHLAKLISRITGREFRKGKITDELYEACKLWLHQNMCHIVPGSDYDDIADFSDVTIEDTAEGTEQRSDEQQDVSSTLDKLHHEQNIDKKVRLMRMLESRHSESESYTLDELLATAREAVSRRGVKILVVDPLNSVKPNKEGQSMKELDWYLEVCNELLGFAHRYNVLVILVAHPRKVDRSLMEGKKRRVEMNDIAGTSDFANKCDYCIVVDRNDNLQVVNIFVDKVKFKNLGTRGSAMLHYDMTSGRYIPCEARKLPVENLPYTPDRKKGEEVIEVKGNYYLKTTDWRYFNLRWLTETGEVSLRRIFLESLGKVVQPQQPQQQDLFTENEEDAF